MSSVIRGYTSETCAAGLVPVKRAGREPQAPSNSAAVLASGCFRWHSSCRCCQSVVGLTSSAFHCLPQSARACIEKHSQYCARRCLSRCTKWNLLTGQQQSSDFASNAKSAWRAQAERCGRTSAISKSGFKKSARLDKTLQWA